MTTTKPTIKLTIKAGAKIQDVQTGAWNTVKEPVHNVPGIEGKYSVYRVAINGKTYSVDYTHVENIREINK